MSNQQEIEQLRALATNCERDMHQAIADREQSARLVNDIHRLIKGEVYVVEVGVQQPALKAEPLTRAKKIGGSYQASGTVVSAFRTLAGEQRYVFEFDEPKGMLHIFGPSQIELHPLEAQQPANLPERN